MPKKVADGTIKISKNGAKFIKVNGKWEYMKKPREEWKVHAKQLTEERIEEIRSLFRRGKTYNYISKTVGCNHSTVAKYCRDLGVSNYDYPPIRIPDNMRETRYSGYYITEDGKAYRAPGKYDRNNQHGKINEYGLIYLKPGYRGHPYRPDSQYECINISVRDENGKFLKQIKKSIHQLVAEAFVPNPAGHNEILHIDDNNRNNHYTNLKWGTHKENMEAIGLPEGTITEHGRKGKNRNPSKYIKKNGDWVLIRSTASVWNKLPDGTITTRKVNGEPKIFIKQNGKWVYQKKRKSKNTNKKDSHPRQILPEGTVTTRADGTTWRKQNGKWIYQKKNNNSLL